MSLKKVIHFALRPLIALTLIYFIFSLGLIKLEQLKNILSDPVIMTSGFILMGLQYYAFSLRWYFIIKVYKKTPLPTVFSLTLVGQFFNLFVPGGIGGDVVKALELSKVTGIKKSDSLLTILIDRFAGLYFMILFSCLLLSLHTYSGSSQSKYYWFISLCLLLAATLGLSTLSFFVTVLKTYKSWLIKKIYLLIESLHKGLQISIKKPVLIQLALTSLLTQALTISIMYQVTCKLVLTPPSYLLFFPLALFAFMASSLPITPGGIGFGQAAFYFIFSPLGPETAGSVAVALSLIHFFNVVYSIPGAWFFIKNKSTNAAPSA